MSTIKVRVAMAAAVVGLIGVGGPAVANAETITLSGSTSVAPLASKLASKYVKGEKGLKFKLLQGGSDVGIADVSRGRVTIGMSSRDPKSSDPSGIVFNKISRDGLCIITSSKNPLPNLNTSQVQAIFGGSVRDWGAVDGSPLKTTINVVLRTAASGTQDAFLKIFMGTTKVFSGASEEASNGLVQQAVRDDPEDSAIGYVSLAFTEGVHTVPYNGVPCDLRNAKSGEYGGVRNFYFVTRGAPTGAAAKFIKWVQQNKKAEKIISTEWVPLD